MSGLDIEAIHRRAAAVGRDNRRVEPAGVGWHGAAHASAGDVPALLAEVERLIVEGRNAQFEVVRLRGELADANRTIRGLVGGTP